jgi:hypothetical protein
VGGLSADVRVLVREFIDGNAAEEPAEYAVLLTLKAA